jgi:pyruvate carboxylase
VNGQFRNVVVKDKSIKGIIIENKKVELGNPKQIGAPLQGMLSNILVANGQLVKKNQPLFVIEAMKMETTVLASSEGSISEIQLKAGTMVNTNDLVLILQPTV